MPRDFAATFARVGWDGIEAEERAHKDTVKGWIRDYDQRAYEAGEPLLCELRRAYLERHYAENMGGKRIPGRRPKKDWEKYQIIGKRMSAVKRTTVEG